MAEDGVSSLPEEIADFLRGGKRSLPIDVDGIAERLGVAVRERRGLPFLGLLERVDGKLVVSLAAGQGASRRRFTLAHELAHAYLSITTSKDQLAGGFERICDDAAGRLLVARDDLRARVSESLTVDAFVRLAREFDVSLQTMAIRLVAEVAGLGISYRRRDGRAWAVGALKSDRHTERRLLEVIDSGKAISELVTRAGVGDAWNLEVSQITVSSAVALVQIVDAAGLAGSDAVNLGEAA